MKTSNILKTAAFVTAAAFTASFTGSYAGEILLKDKNTATASQAVHATPLKAEIVGEPFSDIEKLGYACEDNDTQRISEICDGIIADLDEARAQSDLVAADISLWADDEIIARQQSYASEISVKYAESVKALNELKNGINTEENLAVVRDKLSAPAEYHKSDAAPNMAIQPVEQVLESSTKASSAEIVSPAASADDLVYDRGVSRPEVIKALADKLGSAKDIYLFVKNGIVNEAYSGSKKDPCITLEQLGANDVDQAALLVALLRAKGIPARFISGTVRITPGQAVEITGASDADSAGRLLSARYKNTAKLNHNGQLVGYKMYHTWVEAFIPYTDYRGAGNAGGDSVWVQLDPSFKKVEITIEETQPEFSESDLQLLDTVNSGKEDYPEFYKDIETYADKVEVYFRSVAADNGSYIPSTLPYTVLEADQRYSFIKDSDRASLSISVDGEELLSAYISDIYAKPLIISYEPAGDSDREVIGHYGDLTEVPAYLVNVVPTVTYGDKKSISKKAVSLGTAQKMVTAIKDGTGTTMLDDSVFAGSMYAINLDLQRISKEDAEAAEERLKAAEQNYSPENTLTPEILGAFLDYAGKYYFTLCDSQIAVQASMKNIDHSRQLGLAITGYQFNSQSSYGIVDSLESGAFYIDVAYNVSKAISLDGSKEDEKHYNMAVGAAESYFEGYIWEKLIDSTENGISTVSIMSAAVNEGVDTRFIGRENVEEELSGCNVEESVKQEVRDFVNRGMKVELVPETLAVGDWTGTAYIAYDMNTGSASFMISGGTAGGSSMTFDQMLLFNLTLSSINAGVSFAGMVIGTARFEAGTILRSPSLMLEGMGGIIGGALALSTAFEARYKTLDFIFDYVENGDECLERFEEFTNKNLVDTVNNVASVSAGVLSGTLGTMVGIVTTAYSAASVTDDIVNGGLSADDVNDIASLIWSMISMVF